MVLGHGNHWGSMSIQLEIEVLVIGLSSGTSTIPLMRKSRTSMKMSGISMRTPSRRGIGRQ